MQCADMATTIESTSDEQGDTLRVAEISEALTTHVIRCLSQFTDVSAALKERALSHAVTGIRE
jgi:hypothetical protein